MPESERSLSPLRARINRVIFGYDTPAGKAFDMALIVVIILSVIAVMLESVQSISIAYHGILKWAEWVFTVLFTLEYVLRLYSAQNARRYAFSFFGLVDLLAILPSYLSLLLPGSHFLLTIRVLRVLRVFRVMKLVRFVGEASTLQRALRASRYKISVFVSTVVAIVVIVGSVMYLIEGPDSGFTSIPVSIYWAIVTLTTVGYGDVSPQSPLGQALASALMIVGYGIIAVPTGIVTVELNRAHEQSRQQRQCPQCGLSGHDVDAGFCKACGTSLTRPTASANSDNL